MIRRYTCLLLLTAFLLSLPFSVSAASDGANLQSFSFSTEDEIAQLQSENASFSANGREQSGALRLNGSGAVSLPIAPLKKDTYYLVNYWVRLDCERTESTAFSLHLGDAYTVPTVFEDNRNWLHITKVLYLTEAVSQATLTFSGEAILFDELVLRELQSEDSRLTFDTQSDVLAWSGTGASMFAPHEGMEGGAMKITTTGNTQSFTLHNISIPDGLYVFAFHFRVTNGLVFNRPLDSGAKFFIRAGIDDATRVGIASDGRDGWQHASLIVPLYEASSLQFVLLNIKASQTIYVDNIVLHRIDEKDYLPDNSIHIEDYAPITTDRPTTPPTVTQAPDTTDPVSDTAPSEEPKTTAPWLWLVPVVAVPLAAVVFILLRRKRS
ncbi:MAG: hypothetical protein E7618_01490 [Ruminococcaceae bacterium]|nr:hypothetical protein [Oscillospiraceae bacterium]